METMTFGQPVAPSYTLNQIPSVTSSVIKFSGVLILAGTLQLIGTVEEPRQVSSRTFFAQEINRASNFVNVNRAQRGGYYSPDSVVDYPSVRMIWDSTSQRLEIIDINGTQIDVTSEENDEYDISGEEEGKMEKLLYIEKQIMRLYKVAMILFSILSVVSFLSWIGLGFLPSPIDKTLLLASLAGLIGFGVDNLKREKINGIS